MHCMLMDLLHGFEVLSTTEETLFNSRNVSRLVQNIFKIFCIKPVFMLYGREDAWGNPRIFRCFKLPSA